MHQLMKLLHYFSLFPLPSHSLHANNPMLARNTHQVYEINDYYIIGFMFVYYGST